MKHIIIFLFLGFSLAVQAQYYNDAQFRFNLGLEKKINKKFSVHLDQQDRLTKNFSEFNRASFDLGLTWKVTKNIRLRADYVFIQKKNKYGYFNARNWYYAAAMFKKEFDRWSVHYRAMLQVRHGNTNSKDGHIARYYNRNKLIVKYEATKRLTFHVADEIYIPLNNPQATGIDRNRTFIGTTIRTFKDQEITLYFMYQAQLQNGDWYKQRSRYPDELLKRYYVYGLNYRIGF